MPVKVVPFCENFKVVPFCENCRIYHDTDVPCRNSQNLLTQIYCKKCERIHYKQDPCDFSPETAMVKDKHRFTYHDNNAHRVIISIEAANLEAADEEFMRLFVQDPAESPHISVAVEDIGKGSFAVI